MFRALLRTQFVRPAVRSNFFRPASSSRVFQPPTEITGCRATAAAMVTGHVKGKAAVLLGQQRVTYLDDFGVEEKAFQFPGGLKDPKLDHSFVNAALRELREETGICLAGLVSRSKVHPKLIYQHRTVINKTLHHKAFILFDLKDQLATFVPTAKDDLIYARTVLLEEIERTPGLKEQYSININGSRKPIRPTNGLLITSHHAGGQSHLEQKLNDLSSLERKQGGQALLEAVKDFDGNRLNYLLANEALDQASQETREELIKLAIEHRFDEFAVIVANKLLVTEIANELALPEKCIHPMIEEGVFNIKIELPKVHAKYIGNLAFLEPRLGPNAVLEKRFDHYWIKNVTSLRGLFEKGDEYLQLILRSGQQENLRFRR